MPENDFQQIKDKIDLLSYITRRTGFTMKGKHLSECPFCHGHDCFSIKDSQFKCFQCDDGVGDVFNLIEELDGVDRGEALKIAAAAAGHTLKSKKEKPKKTSETSQRIFEAAAAYYHGHMLENGGREYLIEKRGHTEDILKGMKVGWSTGELRAHLLKKGFTDEQVLASGLTRKTGKGDKIFVNDFFPKGLVIFPHYDIDSVLHFTMKDPAKKLKPYQLPKEHRSPEWKVYNQRALNKYKEVILVEGENDLLSVMGAGCMNVIAMIGQLSDDQIKALKGLCRGKTLLLWTDRDEAGEKYIRKVGAELRSSEHTVKVIEYKGKATDPDEYVRALKGDRKAAVLKLCSDASDYLTWELRQIKAIEDMSQRLKMLKEREIFARLASMPEAEKLCYMDIIEKDLHFHRKAQEEQMENSGDLRQIMTREYDNVENKKNVDPLRIAKVIFDYLNKHGRFFRDSMGNVYLLYHHLIYDVGINRPFNALMMRSTGLLPTRDPGRHVWEAMASSAYNVGLTIDVASWIKTDRKQDAIFVNLNSPSNKILRISADSILEVPNGMNEEGVLLKASGKIQPFNFHPDVSIRDGMELVRSLIWKNITCEPESRYLVLCWLISAFLVDFSPYIALMKFSGATSSGKTTTARLLSLLMYGTEQLGDVTGAAAYALASQNPIVIMDNLETENRGKNIDQFLLLSSTRGGKEKRSQGTDSGTVQESPRSLVLITAIEPFTKAELINRTIDIEFNRRKFGTDEFIEDEVVREVGKKRDIIISSILRFIYKEILPDLSQRTDLIKILKSEYSNHSKNRLDEYLALLMLVLKKMLPHVPMHETDDFLNGSEGASAIWKHWISNQNSMARENETSSNNIIKLLDGLVRTCWPLFDMSEGKLEGADMGGYDFPHHVYHSPEYHLTFVRTQPEDIKHEGERYRQSYIEFTATSGDIVAAFDRYAKESGTRNPYGNAATFGARFRNDQALLKSGGWELVLKEGSEGPYYKKVKGNRYYRMRKLVIQ